MDNCLDLSWFISVYDKILHKASREQLNVDFGFNIFPWVWLSGRIPLAVEQGGNKHGPQNGNTHI